ncbi:MAG TPA: YciI family protein [Devosia sp.]|nr:YciI family protein [Devosia sp.]
MPLYAFIAKDKPNAVEHRLAVRPTHLKHLEALGDRVLFAGSFQSQAGQPTGSLVVIEAPDLASATQTFESDPFVTQGVFANWEISRWNWTVNNPTGRGQ